MTDLQRRTLQVAKSKLGQRETTGRNDGPFVEMLQKWAAKGGTWMTRQPWCVAFATWAVWQAGEELGIPSIIPERASSSRLYAWAKKHGKLLKQPVSGCIGFVRNGGSGDQDGNGNAGKTHIHTFIVHTVEKNGTLVTVEGNLSNRVKWNRRRVGEPLDFMEFC